MKRVLALILALAMLTSLAVTAWASTEYPKVGNIVYSFKKHWGGSSSGFVPCWADEGYCIQPYTAHPSSPSGGSTSPSAIPETIEGYPVVCLREGFMGEKGYSLTSIPAIPKYVQDLQSAYQQQTLAALPMVIPDSVVNMQSSYNGCVNMPRFPTLGTAVENMESAFNGCVNATGTINLPAGASNLKSTFSNCKKLAEIPDISHLTNVTMLQYTFSGCSIATGGTSLPKTVPQELTALFMNCAKMTTPPAVIPGNVTKTSNMFNGCNSLSGEIDIRATLSVDKPSDYANMFAAAVTASGAQLTLNYTAQNEAVIDDIIAKKIITSNLVKGRLLGNEEPVDPPTDPDPGEPENPGDSGGTTPPPTTGDFELVGGKGEQEVIIEGIVEPINTLDVDIPLKLQFIIDEARNITYTQGAKVTSRSPAPLVVTCKSVTAPAGAPTPVADDAFPDWDNLSISQTMGNIAISLNGKNLSVAGIRLGSIGSGFSGPANLPIAMKVLYGKQWNNTSQLVFDYSMNMEIALAE